MKGQISVIDPNSSQDFYSLEENQVTELKPLPWCAKCCLAPFLCERKAAVGSAVKENE